MGTVCTLRCLLRDRETFLRRFGEEDSQEAPATTCSKLQTRGLETGRQKSSRSKITPQGTSQRRPQADAGSDCTIRPAAFLSSPRAEKTASTVYFFKAGPVQNSTKDRVCSSERPAGASVTWNGTPKARLAAPRTAAPGHGRSSRDAQSPHPGCCPWGQKMAPQIRADAGKRGRSLHQHPAQRGSLRVEFHKKAHETITKSAENGRVTCRL